MVCNLSKFILVFFKCLRLYYFLVYMYLIIFFNVLLRLVVCLILFRFMVYRMILLVMNCIYCFVIFFCDSLGVIIGCYDMKCVGLFLLG